MNYDCFLLSSLDVNVRGTQNVCQRMVHASVHPVGLVDIVTKNVRMESSDLTASLIACVVGIRFVISVMAGALAKWAGEETNVIGHAVTSGTAWGATSIVLAIGTEQFVAIM